MHVQRKEVVFGRWGGAKKFRATKYSKAAFQNVVGQIPPPQYLWHCKGMGGECDGGWGGHILQLDWVKWKTFTFTGIHIVRLRVGTKHSALLSILFDGPTD